MPEPFRLPIDGGETVPAIAYAASVRERAGITLILGHGAGAGQGSDFMVGFAVALAARGIDVVTFDFPYMEQGRRIPDRNERLEACYRAVIDGVRRKRRGKALAIGGKSMGGRIASQVAAGAADLAGVVLLGYPLHPPGKPQQQRSRHLPRIAAPMLFVQGERDSFGTADELRAVVAALPSAEALRGAQGRPLLQGAEARRSAAGCRLRGHPGQDRGLAQEFRPLGSGGISREGSVSGGTIRVTVAGTNSGPSAASARRAFSMMARCTGAAPSGEVQQTRLRTKFPPVKLSTKTAGSGALRMPGSFAAMSSSARRARSMSAAAGTVTLRLTMRPGFRVWFLSGAFHSDGIRHEQEQAVEGLELADEEADLLDLAGHARDRRHLDEIAEMERPQPQQHQAGGDIRQRALQGEADGEAGGAEHRQERGGLHAELRQRRDESPGPAPRSAAWRRGTA